jgi:GntR family transcriptional regulator, transcriptional repressor for pyruvate dehydrogenase complex
MFKSVMREASLTARTQLQVEELIISGVLRAGDRLPSERELVEKLGVSKTVVREAVRSLATKGLVEVRPGSGIYVRDINSKIMSEPISLLLRARNFTVDDVHEVREVLEVNIVRLAATRANKKEIKSIEESIEALKADDLTLIEYAKWDVEFHNRLAIASGNPFFSILTNSINEVMLEVRLRALKFGKEQFINDATEQHTKIFEKIKARDAIGAEEAMREHLTLGKAKLLNSE